MENSQEKDKRFKTVLLDGRTMRNLWLDDIDVCGWYGRDHEGEYTESEKCLKYLRVPPSPNVNFDLTLTHELDEEKTSGLTYHHFFKWIMDHSKDESGNPKRPSEKFIVSRCDLQTVMYSPYDRTDCWDMHAVKLKGSTYLLLVPEQHVIMQEMIQALIASKQKDVVVEDQVKNQAVEIEGAALPSQSCTDGGTAAEGSVQLENLLEPKKALTEEDNVRSAADLLKKMELEDEINNLLKETTEAAKYENYDLYCRYGNKFEQYLLSDSPDEDPDPRQPITAFGDFATVCRARLGRFTLLYTGEMDGMPNAEAPNNLSAARFVELKTSSENSNPKSFKRFKLLKWWVQCVLANCYWVLVGYRDDTLGVVRRLERIQVSKMPLIARAEGLWEPAVCFSFLHSFLKLVESIVSASPEGREFVFMRRPKEDIHKEGIQIKIGCLTRKLPDSFVLPEFYQEWLKTTPEPEVQFKQPARSTRPAQLTSDKSNVFMPPWLKK